VVAEEVVAEAPAPPMRLCVVAAVVALLRPATHAAGLANTAVALETTLRAGPAVPV